MKSLQSGAVGVVVAEAATAADSRYHGCMSAARCPRCATLTLVPGHDVHVCTGCGGVWLDAARAQQLLAPLGADLQPSALPQTHTVPCPVCGHGMYICLTRLAGVELDVCGPHGVWFDRQELERVSHAVSRIIGQPVPQAPPGWASAQPPAGHAGLGPGLAVGAAVIGVAATGAAVHAAMGGGEGSASQPSFGAVDVLTFAPDAASTGFAVADSAGDVHELAGEAAGGAAELAGDAASGVASAASDSAEAAGSILGGIFDAIAGIFS